ncbi:MAG: hypothetical protein ACLRMJ_00155 [Alistipes finegoldii]
MNTPEKDYSHRGWIAALALIAVLGAVSFIPPQSLGGVKLRRANILSDILSFEDAAAEAAEPALFDEEEFHIDMAAVAERIEADANHPAPGADHLRMAPRAGHARRTRSCPTRRAEPDADDRGFQRQASGLSRHAAQRPRPVRIAFLGDSFVEGDILTADLREGSSGLLGRRRGIRPDGLALTAFRARSKPSRRAGRPTTSCSASRTARLRENFYVSGWVSQPAAGASPAGRAPTTANASIRAPRRGLLPRPATVASR